MKRGNDRGGWRVLLLVAAFSVSASAIAGALTPAGLAETVAPGESESWRTTFVRVFEARGVHLSSRAYAVVQRAIEGISVTGPPEEVAGEVLQICLQVDHDLRRGVSSPESLQRARLAVRAWTDLQGGGRPEAGTAARLQGQLRGMGPRINGDLGGRPGPQAALGLGNGAHGTAGGASGGGTARTNPPRGRR